MELNHSKAVWPVNAPFAIAYADRLTGKLTLRPYLDLHKKLQIWGIGISNMVFKVTHEKSGDWQTSAAYTDKSGGKMPSTADLEEAYRNREGFDEIINLLKEHGISADNWIDGWYWADEKEADQAVVWDMGSGRAELVPARMKNGFTRLVSRKTDDGRHISVGSNVVYLHGDHLKVSPEFYANRVAEVWGIQLGKCFFRITDEPEKMTWTDATAMTQKISTDKIRYYLPSKEDFEYIHKYRDSVNDTLARLAAYGVKVSFWLDRSYGYLTSSVSGDWFVTCLYERIQKSWPCVCRLAAESKGKQIVV